MPPTIRTQSMSRARPILLPIPIPILLLRRIPAWLLRSALILLLAVPAQAVLAGDGDLEFVQQLTARGLFDLAEQYCERRISLLTEADQRAEWELRLADCFAQHAWSHESTNRDSLVNHAVERTTEFLQQNVVAPPLELNLRLAQIELLLVSAAARKAILHAGRTFQPPGIPLAAVVPSGGGLPGRFPSPGTIASPDAAASRNPVDAPPPAQAVAAMCLAKAAELTEALLVQLEQIQRDLEHHHVRGVRDRARMLHAAILELQSHFPPAGASADELTRRAEGLAQLVRKSAVDDVFKWRASLVLAELQLNRRDFPAFDLQLRGLRPNDVPPGQSEAVLGLRVRGLLGRGQAQDALREIDAFQADRPHLTQELTCLRLECLLGMFELETLLNDESRQGHVAAEFVAARDRTATMTTGVWREAAGRIVARFRHVQLVGVAAADQLDRVEQFTASGESENARTLIQQILTRLPASASSRSRAALLLQAGQLSVRLTDWQAAVEQLQSSRELSQASGDDRTAAAADLLRVYALGQLWQNGTASAEQPVEYEAALTSHLADFPEAETAPTAREWLTRILKVRAPRQAAEELLLLFDQSPQDSRRWEWLCDAGALLLNDCHDRLSGRASDGLAVTAGTELLTKYRQRAAAAVESESETTDHDIRMPAPEPIPAEFSARLNLQLVECDLVVPGTDSIDWDRLNRRLQTARSLFTPLRPPDSPPPITTSSPADVTRAADVTGLRGADSPERALTVPKPSDAPDALFFRSELLGLVVDLRGGTVEGSVASRGHSLLQAPEHERAYAATFLTGQIAGASPSPGNLVLAKVAGRLVESLLTARSSVAERLPLFRTAMIVSALTGETALTQRMLAELLRGELSEDDLARIADALTANTAAKKHVSGQTEIGNLQQKLWQILLRRSPQGSDRWLEASLQTALLARQSGDPTESLRILNVVEVLYPEWGSASRGEAARRLRKQITEPPK